jgi:hypothetical protein
MHANSFRKLLSRQAALEPELFYTIKNWVFFLATHKIRA